MKSRIVAWACLFAGVLWVVAGLRDIFAPGFFTMSASEKSNLDIAMEFASGATFLLIGAVFHWNRRQLDGKRK